MNRLTRRDTLLAGAGALAGSTLLHPGRALAGAPTADVPAPKFDIEKGAALKVLRPSKFVEGDERLFAENTKKFIAQYGVQVDIDNEGWEDLRPKTAVAANVGSGPDIVLAWSDDPHKFASKCLDLTDLAEYLGQKYGGWYELAERMGKAKDGHWIAMPYGGSGGRICYRKSWANEAGFDGIPKDTDGFLKLCQALKKNGHPPGLALGNAVGDANAWCYWVLWTFGGSVVDPNDHVTLDSKETVEALKYAKALSETFIPGVLSWLDPSNNKAFLSGDIGLTDNGISIYYVAKGSKDEAMQKMAEDIFHAYKPVGPVGRPTERALIINSMVFKHTKYPNAAKEYLRFMMEREQYDPWLTACLGYWGHPLKAYEKSSVWTSDPKADPFKDVIGTSLWDGYRGSVGEASAAVLSDFVVAQMVASVCAGQATPEDAAKEAARRAKRYYRA
jgi:multiple sugar transport system substrate-binding protein